METKEIKTKDKKKITVVFVHGWAMNSAVWQSCLPLLPSWIDVICIDLPGHGSMAEVQADGLSDYVRLLSAVTERPVVWVGWSLGGLAVMQLAHYYPERVAGMFLIASTPCFVKQANWANAVERSVFEQFSQSLQEDVKTTIRRFLALQVKGGEAATSTVRELREAIEKRGQASVDALQLGLEILSQTDLRSELSMFRCPLGIYLGERDTLVPVGLADAVKKLNPYAKVLVESGAAHAPFVSHPHNFVKYLKQFVEGLR